MNNQKNKRKTIENLTKHPVNALIIIFSGYLVITLLFSLFFPWLSKAILPNTTVGIYNKDFWLNLLVNLNASLIDFAFFGIALFLLQKKNERDSHINDMINELGDISKYNDQVVNLRKVGILRRLSELKHYNYAMHRMVISGSSTEVRNIELKNSDFTGMAGDEIYINGLQVSHSNLTSSSFIKLRMRNAKFHFCNLKNIKFNSAKLRGVVFASCNFTGASLRNASLQSVIMMGCDMKGVIFEGANMDQANLKGAKNLDVESLCQANSLNYIVADASIIQQVKKKRPDVKFSS